MTDELVANIAETIEKTAEENPALAQNWMGIMVRIMGQDAAMDLSKRLSENAAYQRAITKLVDAGIETKSS